MSGKTACRVIVGALVVLFVRPVAAELTDAQVRNALRRGVDYLKNEQKSDGRFEVTGVGFAAGGELLPVVSTQPERPDSLHELLLAALNCNDARLEPRSR